jgi:hypothetical protein
VRVQRLGSGPVGVVAAWHDAQLTTVGDEVRVPQAQRLPDPHAGLGEQDHQEAVTQVLTGPTRVSTCWSVRVRGKRRSWRKPQRPGGDRPAGGDVVQERPVAAAVDPTPRHQRLRQRHAVACLVVVEAEQRREVLVHRCRAAPARAAGQDRHVLGRGAQPRHEPGDVLDARFVEATPSRSRNSSHSFRLVA